MGSELAGGQTKNEIREQLELEKMDCVHTAEVRGSSCRPPGLEAVLPRC